MAHGSKRYVALKRRLDELGQHLLSFIPPPPHSKTTYTAQELDLTRSYIVLVHAEIESFCEELATLKARRAKQEFVSRGTVTPVLRRLVAYYIGKSRKAWNEVQRPSPQVVDSASNSFLDNIRDNHGVKQENLERLFFPLGVPEPKLNPTWLAQMNSFGTNRGGWAHKSVRALNPPDPHTERTTVNQLLNGLLDIDRIISRLK